MINYARTYISHCPVGEHSQLLLNPLVDNTRVKIELREVSRSTDHEVTSNAPYDTFAIDGEPATRLLCKGVRYDGESNLILVRRLYNAIRDNDVALGVERRCNADNNCSFWDLLNMEDRLESYPNSSG